MDNGAFIFLEENLLPFIYKVNPLMTSENMHVVKGYAHR